MKRILLVSVFFMLGAAISQAEDPAKEFLERMAGQWHSKVVKGEFKGFGVMSSQWSEDKTALLAKEKIFTLDQSSVLGGRPILKKGAAPDTVKMCYPADDGSQFEDEFTITREGKALTGKGRRKGFGGDGKSFSGDLLVSSPDEDHITWNVTNGMIGAKKDAGMILTFIRVKHEEPAK